MTHSPVRWQFFRAGDFDQVRLERGEQLAALRNLDQKLWVALACPTKGLAFDSRTLSLIDSDSDGYVRAPELLAAIDWTVARLKSPETLVAKDEGLALDAIADDDEGRRLTTAARSILLQAGKTDSDTLCVADVDDCASRFAAERFNGDGIIPASATDDEELKTLIGNIVNGTTGSSDRNGEPGVNADQVSQFKADMEAQIAWHDALQDNDQLPLGEATAAAVESWRVIRAKVDDWFTRCQLARYDERAGSLMNGAADDLATLAEELLVSQHERIASRPLAAVDGEARLPLGAGLNPAWGGAVARFREIALAPLLGESSHLDEAGWQTVCSKLEPFDSWLASRPENTASGLDIDTCRAYATGDGLDALLTLIEKDAARSEEASALDDVEKLVRYQRDLHQLARNFVCFSDFYSHDKAAIFQAGTLYLDGRSCELTLPVLNPASHGKLASLSGICLVYCQCSRGNETQGIVAAFTAGDSTQLMVGRNGVFYDREGRDWNATITQIIDHPISLRQAFWSPYRKAGRLLGEQLQKFAAAKAGDVEKQTATAITHGAGNLEPPKTAGQQAFDAGKFAGIFAAIGLAIGAIGTAIASVVTGFLGLSWWQMPVAVAGLMLAISGPSMVMAWFKLRARNLGPLLDANGWAVNARARINIPFGTSLTQVAALPENADRSLADPYAEQQAPWKPWLVAGIIIALILGLWFRL